MLGEGEGGNILIAAKNAKHFDCMTENRLGKKIISVFSGPNMRLPRFWRRYKNIKEKGGNSFAP